MDFSGRATTQDCSGCGATPCDCRSPDTFGYWRRSVDGICRWINCTSRFSALSCYADWSKRGDNATRGPVQRRTEPNPFEKMAEAEVFGIWHRQWQTWVTNGSSDGPPLPFTGTRADMRKLVELWHDQSQCEVRPYSKMVATPKGTMLAVTPQPDRLPLTEERLARLLFECDETVLLAIAEADDREGGSFLIKREGPYAIESAELFERAWKRDERGRRNWAMRTAAAVFARARHVEGGSE